MPFGTWEEAAEALANRLRRATDAQMQLAEAAGVELPANVPELVAAQVLREGLAAEIGSPDSPPPTKMQLNYLSALAAETGTSVPGDIPTRGRLEAWVQVLFAERAKQTLEHLRPARGDVVATRGGSGRVLGIVNSFSADGRLNFVGGHGAGARPHLVEIAARLDDASEEADARRAEARNAAQSRRKSEIERLPSRAKLEQMGRWLGRLRGAAGHDLKEHPDVASPHRRLGATPRPGA